MDIYDAMQNKFVTHLVTKSIQKSYIKECLTTLEAEFQVYKKKIINVLIFLFSIRESLFCDNELNAFDILAKKLHLYHVKS